MNKIIKTIGFILFTVAVVLILLEILVRVFHLAPQYHRPAYWLTYDQGKFVSPEKNRNYHKIAVPVEWGQGAYLFAPNARLKLVYDSNPRGYFDSDNSVEMKINALGFRGPLPASPKKQGTLRILGLGDSITFGEGVKFEDTFLHQIQNILNQDAHRSVEILNLGAGGFSIADEITVFEKKWLPTFADSIDLVLVTFYINDAIKGIDEWGNVTGHNFETKKPKTVMDWCMTCELIENIIWVRKMGKRYEHFLGGPLLERPKWFLKEGPYATSQYWIYAEEKLARLKELSQKHHFDVAVIIFPDLYRLNSKHPFLAVYDFVEETCKSYDIQVFDLFDAFARSGYKEEGLWVHPIDHHPNEIAHKIAAQQISRFLMEILPKPGTDHAPAVKPVPQIPQIPGQGR